MTINSNDNQEQVIKEDTSETNLTRQRKYYEKQLEQERNARAQAEERAAQVEKVAQSKLRSNDDDDYDNDEPYIDKKTLERKLSKVTQKTFEETDNRINSAVQRALSEERKNTWMKNNPDFYDVMGHAEKFAQRDPELAETILEMPDSFERQKLVYKNIKALGIHKKEEPRPSIQETVDKNRRSPYYQPSSVGSPPYAAAGDFSPTGQKAAHDKMKELQARLRI